MATFWENSCSFGLRYVSWNKYLIVSLVFSHFGFWSGTLFLIAPFPDLCLLVPFCYAELYINPANHASGVKNGPTLGVISFHIHVLTVGKTHKDLFSETSPRAFIFCV